MGKEGTVKRATASDGAMIEYEVVGNGPPLVMLHGALSSRSTFARQQEALENGRRLILPSFRGHDATAWCEPPDYAIDKSDVDDVSAVLAAESVGVIDLLGHSSGGATAFAFAMANPDKVRRLILIEPTLLSLLPPETHAPLAQEINAMIALGDAGDTEAVMCATMNLVGGVPWRRLDEVAKERRLRRMTRFAPFVAPHWRGLMNYNVPVQDLVHLKPPTMMIYGADSYDFEAVIADVWRGARPDIEQVIIEGAGHNVHWEAPDTVNGTILKFLE